MPAFEIRAFDPAVDADAVRSLETTIASDFVYAVHRENGELRLRAERTPSPCVKRFEIHLDAEPWTTAFVAKADGRVAGFVALSYEEWNRRLTVHHFYVDAGHRGRGIGRALMGRAHDQGLSAGAVTLWAETSNRNHLGVQIYRKLGFDVCGFDLSLYRGTPVADEFPLFLSRSPDAAWGL